MAIDEHKEAGTKMNDSQPTIRARARLSHPVLHAGSPALVFLKVEVSAGETKSEEQGPPLDLAVVLDRSGSMAGQALASAKEAIYRLIDGLRKPDRLALIAYDDEVDVVFPLSLIHISEPTRRTPISY